MSLKIKQTNKGIDILTGGGIKLDGKSILDLTHPVNSLFISKNNTSPASLFGGEWEQLTEDAYLKIVSSNGGVVGGTSAEHKIPIESMPSHNHNFNINVMNNGDCWTCASGDCYVPKGGGNWTYSTGSTGGSQPYYPYYFGVYAWVRVA